MNSACGATSCIADGELCMFYYICKRKPEEEK